MVNLSQCALTEMMGYTASALVLMTFCFSNPMWLRAFALLSNAAFIVFGYLDAIHPIMFLHMILVPINGYHLSKLLRPRFRICGKTSRFLVRPDQSTAQSLLR
jgi:hypothetical protein